LTSLQLVGREVAKGNAGATAVTANARALMRVALTDVLKLASRPQEALAALAAVDDVAPPAAPAAGPPCAAASNTSGRRLPLFSVISQAHIDMRKERDRNHPDIPILIMRRHVFLDVIADRTPDEYFPSDLQ